VNLYGFTQIFPWFAQVRNPDTLLAHLVFGLSGAYAYRIATRRRLAGHRAAATGRNSGDQPS
jgi:hypothetical protein